MIVAKLSRTLVFTTLCLAAAALPLQAGSRWQSYADGAQAWATQAQVYADTADANFDVIKDAWAAAGAPTSGGCYTALKDAELAASAAAAAAQRARQAADLAALRAQRGEQISTRMAELRRIAASGTMTQEQQWEYEDLKDERRLCIVMLLHHADVAHVENGAALTSLEDSDRALINAAAAC